MTTSRSLGIAATIFGFAYFAWGAWLNLSLALPPLRYDGDHAQAVAHYWRYHVDGAMPPGDLLTDYAFLMHAPIGWWLPMAALSTIVTPLAAAKLLSVLGYVVTGALAWLIVRRAVPSRVHEAAGPLLAAVALVLITRTSACHFFLAGGYARSFGPPLCLLFIAAWTLWGHRAVLAVLVLQAALYPSVVIACGLSYGTYCVLAGPMNVRLRRCGSLAAAGVVIIALGLMQDLRAPAEWGSVVWLADALEMPAWGRGGRINEAPLQPIVDEVGRNLVRPFIRHGHVPVRLPFSLLQLANAFVAAWTLVALAVAGRRLWLVLRAPSEGAREPWALPWQLPALFAGAFAGYLLARVLAFKLYLPYRTLAHSWVWILLLVMPLLAWELGLWIFKGQRARALTFAVVVSLAPSLLFLGDGLARTPEIYTNNGADRGKLHAWLRKHTPLDALFAGDLRTTDRIPLFSYRQVLANRALAHPFRPGFYALVEERIRATYAALYAHDLDDVTAFARTWHVDYLVFHTDIFAKPDPRLFEPVRRDVAASFRVNRERGFALLAVPASAVVFTNGKLRVIDTALLEKALAAGETAGSAPAGAGAGDDESGAGDGAGDSAADSAGGDDGAEDEGGEAPPG